MVKFKQKVQPNACIYGRGIPYKKSEVPYGRILVLRSIVTLRRLKNRGVEYPVGVRWQSLN